MDLHALEGKTVLVIEDDELVLETVTVALETMGAGVLQARNGRRGIEMAQDRTPDLVVSNYNMPEADGLDVLQALRSTPSTSAMPFVFMTANASPSLRERCVQIGADAFLDKSSGLVDLVETVAGLLRSAEDRRQAHRRAS